jgi:integrase
MLLLSTATKTLTIYDTMSSAADEVTNFLDSISRNSERSKKTYAIGLTHFQRFLNSSYGNNNYTLQSIIEPLSKNQINVYQLLDSFVSYLLNIKNEYRHNTITLSRNSITLYLAVIRSYLAYHDIDIVPSKYKRKVKVPKIHHEDEEPIDASDIREILLSCNNRRLKSYLLVVASGGLRATEACAIRLCDIDFSFKPTKIHIRKEYTKTKVARDIYISDEATKFLKEWIDWKYRKRRPKSETPIQNTAHLVFTIRTSIPVEVDGLYDKLRQEFIRILSVVGFDQRKEGMQRRKITLHSFRRFVKTVISDQVNQDYSEWFLGHSKSPYYTKKELARREIYSTKCMKYLTFLDYTTLEATGKNIETRLQEKDSEMHAMKTKYEQDMKAMREEMNQQFSQIMSMIQQNPKLAQVKSEILTKKKLG